MAASARSSRHHGSAYVSLRGLPTNVTRAEIRQTVTPWTWRDIDIDRPKQTTLVQFDSPEEAQQLLRYYETSPCVIRGIRVSVAHASSPNDGAGSADQVAQISRPIPRERSQESSPDEEECPGKVLLLTIDAPKAPVQIKTLVSVFRRFRLFDALLRAVLFARRGKLFALVELNSVENACEAKIALQGWCMVEHPLVGNDTEVRSGGTGSLDGVGETNRMNVQFSSLESIHVRYNNEKSCDFTDPTLPSGPSAPPAVPQGESAKPRSPKARGSLRRGQRQRPSRPARDRESPAAGLQKRHSHTSSRSGSGAGSGTREDTHIPQSSGDDQQARLLYVHGFDPAWIRVDHLATLLGLYGCVVRPQRPSFIAPKEKDIRESEAVDGSTPTLRADCSCDKARNPFFPFRREHPFVVTLVQVCIADLEGPPDALLVEMDECSKAQRAARALDGLGMPPHGIPLRVSHWPCDGAPDALQEAVGRFPSLPKLSFDNQTVAGEAGDGQCRTPNPSRFVRLRHLPTDAEEEAMREWLGHYAHISDRLHVFDEDGDSRSAILERSSVLAAVETILCRDAQPLGRNKVRVDFAPRDRHLTTIELDVPVPSSGFRRDDSPTRRSHDDTVFPHTTAFSAFAPPPGDGLAPLPLGDGIPHHSLSVPPGWGHGGTPVTAELTPAASLPRRSAGTDDGGAPIPSFSESVLPAAESVADLSLGQWSATPLAAPRDDMGR